MKCYYAHCLAIYGTEQEARDILLLEALGFEVVNPNSEENDHDYKRFGMVHFAKLVESCGCLAFRALPDGAIPAGVAEEILMATSTSRLVFELPSGTLRRVLTIEQTRQYLRECGLR